MSVRILLSGGGLTQQKVAELTLAPLGCEVRAAHNAGEARTLAQSFRPDFVLLGTADGSADLYEACRTLDAELGAGTVPIVLVSSAFAPIDEERAAAAGAVGCLRAPWDPKDLIRTVREHCPGLPEPYASPPSPDAALSRSPLWIAVGLLVLAAALYAALAIR
jgi:CheY-like chemotaxis protein